MVEALRASFGSDASWPAPRGGFFLWATLPPEVNADTMILRAVKHGVIYVAGEAFFVSEPGTGPGGTNIVRLSFSAPSAERIREGVRRLAAAIGEEVTERRRQGAGTWGALSPSPAAR
jgi:DNA-binding transcriptional MocR family regulator